MHDVLGPVRRLHRLAAQTFDAGSETLCSMLRGFRCELRKNYNKLLKKGENHPIEKTGQRLRALMPWVQKRNIRGAQAEYTTK
jgi:ketol-acid reductoisomerase